ncbi:ogr/Delta-like zinc finger family protein [Escherichia coli]|nr:hypothetical protein [Escherichia coli]EFD8979073.1 hypothetical protein [Escherichia coli]EJA6043896.1 ogr/Delta-like zinc finger family protein [Escherichia coli]ELQ4025104.1 ogr/Delta-like zinc finger family protein [Escherichia coli]ELR1059265.1 ogr/Delta-like zinc finger family protein [Escherichia coli]
MIYCPSCGHVAHTRRAHFMDDGTKIMIAQCRNIYCSATFEASESFFSDSKDSGMEYISGKQRYRDSLTCLRQYETPEKNACYRILLSEM